MVDVPFPVLNAPGRLPQAAGGRLINCYPETLPATAGKPYAYWRTAGLRPWATTPGVNYRGALLVNNLIYAVIDTSVWTFPASGGAGTQLVGTLLGSLPVTMARNNAGTPDIAIVAPDGGAYWINAAATGATPPGTNNAVISYPNGSGGYIIGSPNSVGFLQGHFVLTYATAKTVASDVNAVNINGLSNATAESKPDALYRAIPLGGQLLLCGGNTIEVWGGENDTGYPWSYNSTIARGIVGINAIAGHDDGFGKGIFFVGDDFKVSTLSGYTPTPVSVPDLDLLIEAEPDKTKITVSVYVAQGHGMVVVQGPNWCWEYDTTLTTWHQRQSHLQQYWRGLFPIWAFGMWVCGDKKSGNLAVIDGLTAAEFGTYDIQTLSITGTPTGGTFTLVFSGQTTAPIAYNATAAQVQTALTALPLLTNKIVCAGGPLPATPVTITFNAVAPQPAIAVGISSLTGGTTPLTVMTHTVPGVVGDPLLIRIDTGPLGAFPAKIRIDAIELYLTKGVGIATGIDPLQTDPDISIKISRDGGQTWSNPRVIKVGRQSLTDGRVRSAIWGQAQNQGVRWRLQESAPLSFAFMGADMQVDRLR
jgi:hypothetical protein